jgi:hypothetical protein
MDGVITLRKKSPLRLAWQFTGQQRADWPSWVSATCEPIDIQSMCLDRRSGAQIVRLGEWLIRDMDAKDLEHWTDATLWRVYEVA